MREAERKKTGIYTDRIEARKAKIAAEQQAGIVPPVVNYDDLFTAIDASSMTTGVNPEVSRRPVDE